MKFLLTNCVFIGDKLLENYLDNDLFKDIAFSTKIKEKLSKNFRISYSYILIPLSEDGVQMPKDSFHNMLRNSIEYSKNLEKTIEIENTILLFFSFSTFLKKNIDSIKFSINPIAIISEDEISITYTDGSFKKDSKDASYAFFKLLKETETGIYDDFTGKNFSFIDESGIIKDATNNIGELTAIGKAIDNFSDKQFQVIISDSEYSIKSFREWIFVWQNNEYKTYSGKTIENKELIKDIKEKINNSRKIIFYKWVKGHDKNSFNELCDKKAKEILGIKK